MLTEADIRGALPALQKYARKLTRGVLMPTVHITPRLIGAFSVWRKCVDVDFAASASAIICSTFFELAHGTRQSGRGDIAGFVRAAEVQGLAERQEMADPVHLHIERRSRVSGKRDNRRTSF